MLIRSEFDIQFQLPAATPFVAVLNLHPSLEPRLVSGDKLQVEQLDSSRGRGEPERTEVLLSEYLDAFGNRCARFVAPAGHLRLSNTSLIDAEPNPDRIYTGAQQARIEDLPSEALQFLLPSRYCEVDRFSPTAQDLFGAVAPGWERATAIRDWVHSKVLFNYNAARPTKTAMDVFIERIGVCRDFQHLAITLSRCLNIPARYVTGYIGDIRMPYSGPGDFSAWYQVFLDGQWIDLDARHNYPRLGRILMATGRDAADVAITTSFGVANLTYFSVESNEVNEAGDKVMRPQSDAQSNSSLPAPPTDHNRPTQTNSRESSPTQTQSGTD